MRRLSRLARIAKVLDAWSRWLWTGRGRPRPTFGGPFHGEKFVFMGQTYKGQFSPGSEAMVVPYDERIHEAGSDPLPYRQYVRQHPGLAVLIRRVSGDRWEEVFSRDARDIAEYMRDRFRSLVALPVKNFSDPKAVAWRQIDDEDVYVYSDGRAPPSSKAPRKRDVPYAKNAAVAKMLKDRFGVIAPVAPR